MKLTVFFLLAASYMHQAEQKTDALTSVKDFNFEAE